MTSSNVDLVRSIVALWERGDFRSVEWADAEIEYVFADGPEPDRSVGIAAMAERWREQLSPWKAFRVEAEAYRELDNERVLLLNHFSAQGRASGLDVGQMTQGACLFHVRAGKVTRLILYWDRERAFADLGLPPEESFADS